MNPVRTIRLGVIADTHGLFDPAIVRHFHGVDHIIHAGDIGRRSVIEQLEMIAPVTAVSGNVDGYEESGFPTEIMIELSGVRIAIRHIIYEGGKLTKEGRAFLDHTRPDICVFGHTHQPKHEWLGDTLLFNPGSADRSDSRYLGWWEGSRLELAYRRNTSRWETGPYSLAECPGRLISVSCTDSTYGATPAATRRFRPSSDV